MAMTRTLIILKPDTVQRGLVGEILARFEHKGLKLVGLKLMQVSNELAGRHYAEHEGKPFYQGLVDYITSSPVVVGVVEGPDVVPMMRGMVGATKPAEAAPGTIRFDYGVTIGRNLIHASDGDESAEREIALWFTPEELVSWTPANEGWVIED